ncbi:MAG: hypothetical protein ACK5OB_02310 [Pirellula sp.]
MIVAASVVFALGDCATSRALADDAEVAAALLEQLDAKRFTERQQAFLKLCNTEFDIDGWLESQSTSPDANRAALCVWLRRIRGLQGTLEDRVAMLSDYIALSQGNIDVLNRYVENRRTVQAIELIELLPKSAREGMMQYRASDHPFDSMLDNAWKEGQPDLVPRLLNAILPNHPIRVGLNSRWRAIGMPKEWQLEEPTEPVSVQVAALERDGKIDEAIALAKRRSLRDEYERLLMRHGRWKEWLEIDPLQLTAVPPPWNDVCRGIVLESLGRHDEADAFYQTRKLGRSRDASQQIQTAQLALIVGDNETLETILRENASEELVAVYFLRYQLDALLELEQLTDKDLPSIDRWLDKHVREGKPLAKPIRFQSLFKRLGYPELSSAISLRIESFVATHDAEQQLNLWNQLLNEWPRYGLDEERLKGLAAAVRVSRKEAASGQSIGGEPAGRARAMRNKEGNSRSVTVDGMFFKAFPMLRWAAFPMFETLRAEHPEQDVLQALHIVEELHEGRMPAGWDRRELESFFRRTLRRANEDSSYGDAAVVDMAETLDAMGMTEAAMRLLQEGSPVYGSRIQIARLAAKLGQTDLATTGALALVDQHPEDLEVYLVASRTLMSVNRLDDWLTMQQRVLTRLDCWSMLNRYMQNQRRDGRMETPPEIEHFLELMHSHAPSNWEEMWYGDIYSMYGLSMLSNMIHKNIGKHPERSQRLSDMMRTVCISEIAGITEDGPMIAPPGQSSNNMRWEIDWARWCWQYERCLAAAFWSAVDSGDRELADRLIRAVHRMNPEQMNTLIEFIPIVRDRFGESTLREWFEIFYEPMRRHLDQYPNDTLIANNAAWLSAKCGFELERAAELAQRASELAPSDTYLDTLAEVEFVRGNIERAIELSERCRAMQPRDVHHPRQLVRFRDALKRRGTTAASR